MYEHGYPPRGNGTNWLIAALVVAILALVSGVIDIGVSVPSLSGVANATVDTAEDAVDGSKELADNTVTAITPSTILPLEVDMDQVVEGAVSGMTSYGRAEREVLVIEASQRRTSRLFAGLNDETLFLRDGVYVRKAFVPGPLTWTVEDGQTTITLGPPQMDGDTSIRVEPIDDDDQGLFSEIGAVPGDKTRTDGIRREMSEWLREQALTDGELFKAASCWAIESVYEVLHPELLGAGFELVDSVDDLYQNTDINAVPRLMRVVVQAEFLVPGTYGPPYPIDREHCAPIIESTKPVGYEGSVIEVITLEQEVVPTIELSEE